MLTRSAAVAVKQPIVLSYHSQLQTEDFF